MNLSYDEDTISRPSLDQATQVTACVCASYTRATPLVSKSQMTTRPSSQPAAQQKLLPWGKVPSRDLGRQGKSAQHLTRQESTPGVERHSPGDAVLKVLFDDLGQLDALERVCRGPKLRHKAQTHHAPSRRLLQESQHDAFGPSTAGRSPGT